MREDQAGATEHAQSGENQAGTVPLDQAGGEVHVRVHPCRQKEWCKTESISAKCFRLGASATNQWTRIWPGDGVFTIHDAHRIAQGDRIDKKEARRQLSLVNDDVPFGICICNFRSSKICNGTWNVQTWIRICMHLCICPSSPPPSFSYAMLCYVVPHLVLPQPPSCFVVLCYVVTCHGTLRYVMLSITRCRHVMPSCNASMFQQMQQCRDGWGL